MCQKLWKLAGSRQSYSKNYQAYFFWPTLYTAETTSPLSNGCNHHVAVQLWHYTTSYTTVYSLTLKYYRALWVSDYIGPLRSSFYESSASFKSYSLSNLVHNTVYYIRSRYVNELFVWHWAFHSSWLHKIGNCINVCGIICTLQSNNRISLYPYWTPECQCVTLNVILWCEAGVSAREWMEHVRRRRCGVKSSIAEQTCYLRSTTTSENSLCTVSADAPHLSLWSRQLQYW